MKQQNRKPFSALYVKNFRLFWLAQVLSLSGTWMHHVAQGWLIYSLTQSPFYLGLGGAALTLPILFFSIFGGFLADRYPKRSILLITQSVSMVPPLLLGLLTETGVVTVWHAIGIAFLIGTINAIDMPVRQSFLIEMVGRGNLLNAIALSSAAFNGARMIGPLIAGVAIAKIGLPACFYINAVSFLPVIMALRAMVLKGIQPIKTSRGLLESLREGGRFIIKNRDILGIITTILIFSLFGMPYSQFLPVFADRVLSIGAQGLGMLMSSAGMGAFTAAMMIALRSDIRNKARYMGVSAILFPLSLIIFSLSRTATVSYVMLFLAGWSIVSFLANANSTIQLRVDDSLRGRVMSVYSMVFLGMAPIGSALIGSVADILGTPVTITVAASVTLIAGLLFVKRLFSGLTP